MKYKDLDCENIQDERDLRNLKISLGFAIIASSWALKGKESPIIYLKVAIITAFVFIFLETTRMILNRSHSCHILDSYYKNHDHKGNVKLDDLDIDANMNLTKYGKASNILFQINTGVLISSSISLILGAINLFVDF